MGRYNDRNIVLILVRSFLHSPITVLLIGTHHLVGPSLDMYQQSLSKKFVLMVLDKPIFLLSYNQICYVINNKVIPRNIHDMYVHICEKYLVERVESDFFLSLLSTTKIRASSIYFSPLQLCCVPILGQLDLILYICCMIIHV